MKFSKYLLVVAFSLLFISCSESPLSDNAAVLTISDINKEAGYAWFEQTVAEYQPDVAIIAEIQKKFDPTKHKVNIFVKPSCSCEGTHKYFPNMIKVMRAAGIQESSYTMYSMSKNTDKHPLQDVVTLTDLPRFFLFKDNLPIYSIMDTIESKSTQKSVEQIFLEALNK